MSQVSPDPTIDEIFEILTTAHDARDGGPDELGNGLQLEDVFHDEVICRVVSSADPGQSVDVVVPTALRVVTESSLPECVGDGDAADAIVLYELGVSNRGNRARIELDDALTAKDQMVKTKATPSGSSSLMLKLRLAEKMVIIPSSSSSSTDSNCKEREVLDIWRPSWSTTTCGGRLSTWSKPSPSPSPSPSSSSARRSNVSPSRGQSSEIQQDAPLHVHCSWVLPPIRLLKVVKPQMNLLGNLEDPRRTAAVFDVAKERTSSRSRCSYLSPMRFLHTSVVDLLAVP